jgi:hypothetical protein
MICDPRIAVAAPATFIMNRQTYMHAGGAQDSEQIWHGMTALRFDHEEILLSMVPRPVAVLAVTSDFFPIEGTRRFWELHCKNEQYIQLVEDDSVHSFTKNLAKAVAEFFSSHLLGHKVSPSANKMKPLEPSLLWCTLSGQVRSEYADSRAVHEETCTRLEEACQSPQCVE